MTTTAEKDFLSIGMLASHVQRPVRTIEQTAAALGIQPALKINTVPYFNGDQVERLTEAISSKGSK